MPFQTETSGRGTNRLVEARRTHAVPDPEVVDEAGGVAVTFRAVILAGARDFVPSGHQVGTKSGLSRDQVQAFDLAEVSTFRARGWSHGALVPNRQGGRQHKAAILRIAPFSDTLQPAPSQARHPNGRPATPEARHRGGRRRDTSGAHQRRVVRGASLLSYAPALASLRRTKAATARHAASNSTRSKPLPVVSQS